MNSLLLVGLGGGLGAMARYLLGSVALQLSPDSRFPYGTFVVNVVGCLAIGVLAGMAGKHDWLSPQVRLFLMTGLLGGFTTFSAFGLETVELLRRGEWSIALAYVGGSVAVAIAAVWIGLGLGSAFPR